MKTPMVTLLDAAIVYGDTLVVTQPTPDGDRKALFEATHALLEAAERYAAAMRKERQE